jgi:transposase-like protein
MLDFINITCPYCGESFETAVDSSAGSQRYVEDCAVCCRPIEVGVSVDDAGELIGVQASTENE